jgi:hypothetical protein
VSDTRAPMQQDAHIHVRIILGREEYSLDGLYGRCATVKINSFMQILLKSE